MKRELWTSQEMIKMAKAVLEDVSYDELGNPTYSNPIFCESIFNEKTVHDMLVQGAKHYDDLKNKTLRNCDLYETENEAKEAYEELFYVTFQLKNCKDTIVALKPGSPEFSTWLMTPIKPNEQKRLSDKKEAKLSEMKSVMDVVRAMTGVPPNPFYYNSEVRELGHRIEELYTKEISNLKKKGA